MPIRVFLLSATCLASLPAPALAETRTIDDVVTVTGQALPASPVRPETQSIPAAQLEARAVVDLAEGIALAASANVTTNSRGETLVYLRNAGERQIATYFDGAAINVPWDNRLNLSVLPAGAVGALDIHAGTASALYGVNASGGVIEIEPAQADHRSARFSGMAGSEGFADFALTGTTQAGPGDLLLAASRSERDALTAPSDLTGDTLTNTDFERTSLNAQYSLELPGDFSARVNVLAVESAFGIQPAQFDRPSQGEARYWRYPESDHLITLLRTSGPLGAAMMDATFWRQEFDQTIESYASDAYAVLEDVQVDDDTAYGGRLLMTAPIGPGTFRTSLTALEATHVQTDRDLISQTRQTERFKDQRLSLGAEYSQPVSDNWSILASGSRDRQDALDTAGRPDNGAFDDWSATAAASWDRGEAWTLRLALSRKARIPTMRELYGTAIGRFLPNPDLEAEHLVIAEAEFAYAEGPLTVSVTPFYSEAEGTLGQRNLTVNGQRLRQRINLRGSEAWGMEARIDAEPVDNLILSGQVLATHLRRLDEPGAIQPLYVSERPELIARISADYRWANGWGIGGDLHHRGEAFSLTDEDVFEPLEVSTALDLRADYRHAASSSAPGWRAYAVVSNVTDTLIEPQLGLPAAGRTLRVGLSMDFGG